MGKEALHLGAEDKPAQFWCELNQPNHELLEKLTVREWECLVLLSKGFSRNFIALQLGLSPRTIETHINNIKAKIGCTTKGEIIRFLLENNFVLFHQ